MTRESLAERLARYTRYAPVLAQEYPFVPRELELPAGRLSYLDEGPREGPAVLCLHGNPTWSFLFRSVVRELSRDHRVVVPDHMGCGLSDRPAPDAGKGARGRGFGYTLAEHAGHVEALVDALGLDRITLVLHDWGGAIGMGLARRRPARVARIVATNTAAFRSSRMPLRIALCRLPVAGPTGVLRFNLFARAATFMTTVRPLPAAVRRAYLAPWAKAADRLAVLRFVQDIPMRAGHPSWPELVATEEALAGFRDRPVCLLWGERDWCFTPRFREEWQRRFPEAEVRAFAGAGHYLYEDAPDDVVREMRGFLERHPLPAAAAAGAP